MVRYLVGVSSIPAGVSKRTGKTYQGFSHAHLLRQADRAGDVGLIPFQMQLSDGAKDVAQKLVHASGGLVRVRLILGENGAINGQTQFRIEGIEAIAD